MTPVKIIFLGTSHGVAEKRHFCSSAVLACNDCYYIIDAGAPIMTLLQDHDIPFEKIAGIFITHTHEDHFMGLVEFTYQINAFPNFFSHLSIPVYVPDEQRYHDMFRFILGSPEFKGNVEYRVYGNGDIFDDGNVRIRAIPTRHIENAHAFEILAGGRRLLFSGDLKAGFPDYPRVLTEEPFDMVVLEGAHTRLDSPEALRCLQATQTKRLLINHIYFRVNPPETIAKIAGVLKDQFPVSAVRDGDVIDV